MLKLLDLLNEYIWLADALILLVFALLALKRRQNNSSLMTLALVAIFSGVLINYSAMVNAFVAPDTSETIWWLWCLGFAIVDLLLLAVFYLYYQQVNSSIEAIYKYLFVGLGGGFLVYLVYAQAGLLAFELSGASYKDWIIAAFYLGTALIDIFVIYGIYKVHQLTKVAYSLLARTYFLAFLIAANLQVISFVELYFWQTKHLVPLYQWGLASINICTTAIALVVILSLLVQNCRKTDHQGLLWKL